MGKWGAGGVGKSERGVGVCLFLITGFRVENITDS